LKKVLFLAFILLLAILSGCGHNHEYKTEVIAPDCTQAGYTLNRCSCGDEYKDNIIEPLGHDYKLDKVVPSDCKTHGSETFVCSRCGDSYTEELELAPHDIENAEYILRQSGAKHILSLYGQCKVCGEYARENAATFAFGLDTDGDKEPDVDLKGGKLKVTLKSNVLTLNAIPNDYFRFISWSDGNTDSSRTINADDAGSINAVFEYERYNMPVLNIDTGGKEVVSLDYYVNCTVTLTNCDKKYILDSDKAGIRVRGNASANYGDEDWIRNNKVHYRLKFDSRTSVLGINNGAKCKSWVLLRGDTHFIKEPISFFMGKKLLGGEYFVSDYTYVDVYFNYQYMGVYIICDQIQIDRYRIDIDELEDGERRLKTGYLIEIDNYARHEPYHFFIDYDGVSLTDMYGITRTAARAGYSIKYDTLTNEQLNFVSDYISKVYRIVYKAIWEGKYYKFDSKFNLVPAPEFTNSMDAVANVMDLDSLVGMYILHELCEERDVGVGSFYMYVDFTLDKPLLTFCAPWDFSWAFGDDTGFRYDKFSTSAWQPDEFIRAAGNRSSTWFITLYHADWFVDMVKDKWTTAVDEGWFNELFEEMTRVSDTYENEFIKNSLRWNSGDQRWNSQRIGEWLEKRINWLNTQWYKGK
jgi:hypothetical protein